MKILNFGSLNIDHVYGLKHFVQPGETIKANNYQKHPGGKGLNQSIALARAGVDVQHAGKIGDDGAFLLQYLQQNNVTTDHIQVSKQPSGHATIQVNQQGENSIVIFGGANQDIDNAYIENTLNTLSAGDILLLQNEINSIPKIMQLAHKKNIRIFFNAAPITDEINQYPLHLVDTLIVNEIEAKCLAKINTLDPKLLIAELKKLFSNTSLLITLGKEGVIYQAVNAESISIPSVPATPADTTAAGDTFIGFFIAMQALKKDIKTSLKIACKASSYCIQHQGAAESIPTLVQIEKF